MGEIDAVRALLGGRPRPEGWAERRRRIEEVAGIDPVPPGVTVTPTEMAGCPVRLNGNVTASAPQWSTGWPAISVGIGPAAGNAGT